MSPPSPPSSSLPPRYDQLSLRGQALTNQNAELLHYIDNLRRRRDAADAALRADEAERAALQREAAALSRRLGELGERVAAAARARDECAGILANAESAYEKILQSAQSLRDVLKAEASEIGAGGGVGGTRRGGGRREEGGNGRESSSSDSGNNSTG